MKNIIVAALVGISFLTSGFWVGLRFAPVPKKAVPTVAAKVLPKPIDPKVAFSIETLKHTTENIFTINQALQGREAAVAAREKLAKQKEDELAAERAALDRLHVRFRDLYTQFQKRLQLVTDTETGALQRQVTIFDAMDPVQAIDLMRTLDDATITRLFALMDDKPLARIVGAWRAKYPADSARMLADLNGMGRVVAKDKIDLPDAAPSEDSTTPKPPTTSDVSTPASAASADGSVPAAADSAPAPTAPQAPAPAAPAVPSLESTDISGHEPYLNSGTPPPDIGVPSGSAAPAPADQDQTTPTPAPSAPPPANNAAAPASASAGDTLLDSPSATAQKAAAAYRARPNNEQPPAHSPAEFSPTTPSLRLSHDKGARFASTTY